MTRKVYRTAQGKMVDLGALQLQNESVRAVGNMGINARGDTIDGWNRPIDSRNKQVGRQYNRQTASNVVDRPVAEQPQPPEAKQVKKARTKAAPQPEIPATPEDFDDAFEKPVVEDKKSVGLAAAIARARQIRQEPISGSGEIIPEEKPGITKI